MSAWIWITAGIFLIFAEILIPGLVVIFLGISALLVGIAVYFGLIPGIFSQAAVWLILSAVLIILIREHIARLFPSLEKKNYSSKADDLIGKSGVVIEPLAPGVTGRVRVHGTAWHARLDEASLKKNISLEADARVLITHRENLLLFVSPSSDPDKKEPEDPLLRRPDPELYSSPDSPRPL